MTKNVRISIVQFAFTLSLNFFLILVSTVSFASPKSPALPTWLIIVNYDQQVQVTFYRDTGGKPDLKKPVAEILRGNLVDPKTGRSLYDDYPDGLLEGPVHFDASIQAFGFSRIQLKGQAYIKVRLKKEWAWIPVTSETEVTDLAQDEVECYRLMKLEESERKNKKIKPLKISSYGAASFSDKLSVLEGDVTRRLIIKTPGVFEVIAPPSNSSGWFFSIQPFEIPKNISYDGFSHSVQSSSNTPYRVLLPVGEFKLSVTEVFEGDATPVCPANSITVKLMHTPLPNGINVSDVNAMSNPQVEIVPLPPEQVHKVLLTRLFPAKTFVLRIKKETELTLDQIDFDNFTAWRVGFPGKTLDRVPSQAFFRVGPGDVTIIIEPLNEEDLPADTAKAVSFKIKAE